MLVAEAHSFSKTRATAPPGGQEPSLGAQLHRTTQGGGGLTTYQVPLSQCCWVGGGGGPDSSGDSQPLPLGSPDPTIMGQHRPCHLSFSCMASAKRK